MAAARKIAAEDPAGAGIGAGGGIGKRNGIAGDIIGKTGWSALAGTLHKEAVTDSAGTGIIRVYGQTGLVDAGGCVCMVGVLRIGK